MRRRMWRWLASVVVVVAAAGLTAGCDAGFGARQDGGRASAKVQLWMPQDGRLDPVVGQAVARYNGSSAAKAKLELTTYPPDVYQQKIQETLGTPKAPDIFLNWGGATLAQYVTLREVLDLSETTSGNRPLREALLPAVLETGRFNGKQYGLPMSGVQPVLLFYNKDVFARASVAPPKTYDDLLALVDTFKAKKITPIALAGATAWPTLMYPMYLLDRVGGPQKFADITAGKPGAWRDPAVLRTLTMCQDLAKRGAFGDNFASVAYGGATSGDDSGGGADPGGAGETAGRLLASGKAAMHVMGSWEYARQLATSPDFARSGLGWTALPAVTGGAGDPRDVVGPPGNVFSVAAGTKHRDAAIDFLTETLASDDYVRGLVKAGEVPAVRGADAGLAGSESPEFTTFVFRTVADAPVMTPAWDQALAPETSAAVGAAFQRLLVRQITPEDFLANVEKAK